MTLLCWFLFCVVETILVPKALKRNELNTTNGLFVITCYIVFDRNRVSTINVLTRLYNTLRFDLNRCGGSKAFWILHCMLASNVTITNFANIVLLTLLALTCSYMFPDPLVGTNNYLQKGKIYGKLSLFAIMDQWHCGRKLINSW